MERITILGTPSEARRVRTELETILKAALTCSPRDLYCIKLAMEEAFLNAIQHGNQMDPNKTLVVDYAIHADRFEIHITDEGEGFDPDTVPDPREEVNLDQLTGRGLLIMQYFMTEVRFNAVGNCVSMSRSFINVT